METIESFANRALAHTGLDLADIPDGDENDLLCGSIACRRGAATVVLVDHIYQDDDGVDWYARAVCVGRTEDLPPAREGAEGRTIRLSGDVLRVLAPRAWGEAQQLADEIGEVRFTEFLRLAGILTDATGR